MGKSSVRVSPYAVNVFRTLITACNAVFGIRQEDLTSKSRKKILYDIRRMMYHILRRRYGFSYCIIGQLFNRDHSTVLLMERKHEFFFRHESEYAHQFNCLMDELSRTKSPYMTMHNQVILKELSSSDRDTFNILLSCFNKHSEVTEYIKENGVDKGRIIFCGYSNSLSERVAQESVAKDVQSYIESLMKKSTSTNEIEMNAQPDIHYMDYGTQKFDILNNAYDSYMSAVRTLGNKTISLIYAERQERGVIFPISSSLSDV